MKLALKILSITLLLALGLNFRWVHAASASLMGDACQPAMQAQARARVGEYFGKTLSQPRIRCLPEPALGLDVSYGQANFAPLLPTVLLLGPKGTNIDVMAHEWAHAEVSHRLGFFKRAFALPTWIDEGLAMQVDHREDYNLQALAKYNAKTNLASPAPEDIATAKFFAAAEQGKLHYAISRCAVSAWQKANSGWLQLLAEDLPEAIQQLNQQFEGCR